MKDTDTEITVHNFCVSPPSRSSLSSKPNAAYLDHGMVFQKRVVGDHRGYWSAEAAPFQTMFAIVGDSLEFKYEGNVSLFSFPDQVTSCLVTQRIVTNCLLTENTVKAAAYNVTWN